MARNVTFSGFAKTEDHDYAAAFTRSMVYMATSLLREFTHAVHKAMQTRTNGCYGGAIYPGEMFWRDDRIAEHGWAFTQYVFGAGFTPLGRNPLSYTLPYGLGLVRFPSAMNVGTARGSAARWGITHSPRGIVDVEFYAKLMRKRFWAVDVARGSGGEAFKVDWKVAITYTERGPNNYFPGEPRSPLIRPGMPDNESEPWTQLRRMGFLVKQVQHHDKPSLDSEDYYMDIT